MLSALISSKETHLQMSRALAGSKQPFDWVKPSLQLSVPHFAGWAQPAAKGNHRRGGAMHCLTWLVALCLQLHHPLPEEHHLLQSLLVHKSLPVVLLDLLLERLQLLDPTHSTQTR